MAGKNLDGVLIKKANKKQKFTEWEISEFMKCQDPVDGPAYFANNYFYIQHPTKGKIQYKAYPYQKKLLDSYHTHVYSVNLLGRQMGKCVDKDVKVCIINKVTNVVYDIPIGIFFDYVHAKENSLHLPDITQFARKTV
jgi:hypothetical protein